MTRSNNRADNALRPVNIIPHFTEMAAGSVLIELHRSLPNDRQSRDIPRAMGMLQNFNP